MNVSKALLWLIDNEPQGLSIRGMGQTVFFNGEDIEVDRDGCAPVGCSVTTFIRMYRNARFGRKWLQLNYYQQGDGERPLTLGYAGCLR